MSLPTRSVRVPPHVGSSLSPHNRRLDSLPPCPWQLLFNLSGAYLTPPILTQPARGAHAEHLKYKQASREFAFEWQAHWRPLREVNLTAVPLQLFTLAAEAGSEPDCIEALGAMAFAPAAAHHHQQPLPTERGMRHPRHATAATKGAKGAALLAGLPAHVQVLAPSVDAAAEYALERAAAVLRGMPSHGACASNAAASLCASSPLRVAQLHRGRLRPPRVSLS